MDNDSQKSNQDAKGSDIERAQDLSKEAVQQKSDSSKPESYGTMQMVSAKDYNSDPGTERLHG